MQEPAKIIPDFEDRPTRRSSSNRQSESISAYLEELHTPALVATRQTTVHSKPSKITLSNSHSTKDSARFVVGLNNRVVNIDHRIRSLEAHLDHLGTSHIGVRHWVITIGSLALLIAILFLGFREYQPNFIDNDPIERSLLEAINQSEDKKQRAAALSLLAKLSDNQTIQKWAASELESHKIETQDHYRWPLEKQKFSPSGIEYEPHKRGINIFAKLGDPIVAMKTGEVVYSGQGIAGYGKLILIQHSDELISIYGNNYSNYVVEGTKVKQGQLIAAVGEGSGKQASLYFEIRYKGEPEDPFLYFNQ